MKSALSPQSVYSIVYDETRVLLFGLNWAGLIIRLKLLGENLTQCFSLCVSARQFTFTEPDNISKGMFRS